MNKLHLLLLYFFSCNVFAVSIDDCNKLFDEKKYNEYVQSCSKYSGGNSIISWNLAQIFQNGLSNGGVDKEMANSYAELASNNGVNNATKLLCNNYNNSSNYEKAFWYCSKPSLTNDADSTLILAKLYELGLGTKQDKSKAKNIYLELSQKGNHEAQYKLAKVELDSDPQSIDGLFWLRKSFQSGNQEAKLYVDYLTNLADRCDYLTNYFDSSMSIVEAKNTCKDNANASNAPKLVFASAKSAELWYKEMSKRIKKVAPKSMIVKDDFMRERLLTIIQYESVRAGLDPQIVLSVVTVLSKFEKYKVSDDGAIGLMQVMPYWVEKIGSPDQDLFNIQTNVRYGCTLLRFYLQKENGNLIKALGRYVNERSNSTFSDAVFLNYNKYWKYNGENH